jgi:hypothetical protein
VNRTLDGWSTTPLKPPLIATYPRFEGNASSSDLSRSLWSPTFPDSATEDIFLREESGLVRVGPGGPPGAIEPRLIFAGASSDLSHLVFTDGAPLNASSEVRLWPGDATRGGGELSLYEYIGSGNTAPLLVGVSNSGVVDTIGESHLISQCGTNLGNPEGDMYNAISRSGATVFFTALGRDFKRTCQELPPGVEPAVNELYARVDNGLPDAHTVAISEPVLKDCEACGMSSAMDAQFRGASMDGSKVFFTTTQRLLGASGEGPYLYEYDFGGREGKRVTLVSAGDATGARIQGVVRVSEDGSHVYFVAQGVLTGAEVNAHGDQALEGAENLYVAIQECADGSASCTEPVHRLTFVGRLSETDNEDWNGFDIRPAQATPDGRFLVFQSTAELTPDEKGRPGAGQVFEFDAQTGALTRLSHGANGYNEDGNGSVYPATISSPSYYLVDYPESPFAAVSADGSYAFFTSSDALSPQAVTGHSSVYEYHTGEVSLISDGHDISGSGSTLLGADESGEDVFFTSGEPLVPQDGDTQPDIYDARIGGGFPPAAVGQSCSEDACQGPLAGALQPAMPPTASSAGEGEAPTASGPSVKTKAHPKRPKPRKRRRKHSRAVKHSVKRKG